MCPFYILIHFCIILHTLSSKPSELCPKHKECISLAEDDGAAELQKDVKDLRSVMFTAGSRDVASHFNFRLLAKSIEELHELYKQCTDPRGLKELVCITRLCPFEKLEHQLGSINICEILSAQPHKFWPQIAIYGIWYIN